MIIHRLLLIYLQPLDHLLIKHNFTTLFALKQWFTSSFACRVYWVLRWGSTRSFLHALFIEYQYMPQNRFTWMLFTTTKQILWRRNSYLTFAMWFFTFKESTSLSGNGIAYPVNPRNLERDPDMSGKCKAKYSHIGKSNYQGNISWMAVDW